MMKPKTDGTLLGRAMAASEEAQGGRYALEGAAPTIVIVGATAIPQVPRLPSKSPWARDPVPAKGPLGFSVDELPACGGAGEADEPCASLEVSPSVSDRGAAEGSSDD
jgi:hypothetical protein